VTVVARAPGRVNLIGDHTDYTGGLVLPMAIDRWTTVTGERFGEVVAVRSDGEAGDVEVPIGADDLAAVDPARVKPPWGRYVAGVVAEARPVVGFSGRVTSTVPIGSGLSSSAALEVSVALAVGVEGTPLAVAQLCQRAEQRATGVPCGIMDQLTSAGGVEGAALLIDCRSFETTPVWLPDDAAVVVVNSGQSRTLAGSAYADRVAQTTNAERIIGPLRRASLDDVQRISHPIVRARARHVISENERVLAFAAALRAGDLATAGRLMVASHTSLRDDYEVSTPVLDDLVAELVATPGVFGARLTGAGFGGCVVALTRPGALRGELAVRAVAGASVTVD
jgi:galactokinase